MYQHYKTKVARFLTDESGPTAVEYAVMMALIIGLCITSIGLLGIASFDMWSGNSNDIDQAFNGLSGGGGGGGGGGG